MYEKHFGFKIKPFSLTPDPAFLYPSRQHAMAMTSLEYGLESQAAFSLLTGDVGSGKTTLVRSLLRGLGDQVVVGLISHTHSQFKTIHSWALSALGIKPTENTEIGQYAVLVDSFVREYAKGKRTLLIIDEAQNLSIEVLEELRLLSNVNSERDLVLQLLLVGQPELRTKLSCPEMAQFAQRVSVDFHLKPLDRSETHAYVRHRLEVAGGSPALFTADAVEFVHARTKGVPRLVNQLCDYGLLYAFADGLKSVDADLISQVLRERGAGVALASISPAQPESRKTPIGIAGNGAA
jgi:general secretion pathway protein A